MTKPRTKLETVFLFRNRWTLDFIDFDGKQKRKTLKTETNEYPKNKTQAKHIADQFLQNLRNMQSLRSEQEYINRVAERQQLIQRLRFTLDDVLPMIEGNPKLQNGTRMQNRRYQWLKFYQWIKNHYPRIKTPHEITPLMAQEFINELYAECMANSTFNDYVTSYRMFFKMIMLYGGMLTNPFAAVERLPRNTVSHRPIPKEFIPRILAACDDPEFHVMETRRLAKITKSELKTLIMLGLCTGMRLKDCALLDWSSVNFDNNYIKAVAYKTQKCNKGFLWIPMMTPLREHLLSFYQWQAEGAVMPNIASRYLDEERKKLLGQSIKTDNGNMSSEVKNLLKFVGLPITARLTQAEKMEGVMKNVGRRHKSPNLYGFHSFRHFFVSTCAENNVPMAYVEAIVGDDSAVIKEYYTHINPDDMMRSICNIQSKFIVSAPALPLAQSNAI